MPVNHNKNDTMHAAIGKATELLAELDNSCPFPPRLKRASLSENWFSDQLAWLLNPSGSHGLGTKFATEFLKTIARIRTQCHPNSPAYYHRSSFLRWHRSKVKGTHATHFDLGNAAVYREFYLSGLPKGGRIGQGMLCDVVFLDLDPKDGVVVSIENKLFTTNRPGQLERYYEIVESRYARAKVKEYVYLTLLGDPPKTTGSTESKKSAKRWVRLSWVRDILDILEKLTPDRRSRTGIGEVISVLRWLRAATGPRNCAQASEIVQNIVKELIAAASACLVDELQRLNEGARGNWRVMRTGKTRTRIGHTSKPSMCLFVGVKPNLSLVLYSNNRSRITGGNLVIPFSSSVDQTFNLMDLATLDIFPWYFGASYRHYRGPARRLRTQEFEVRGLARPIFDFVNDNSQQFRLLIPITRLSTEMILVEEEDE